MPCDGCGRFIAGLAFEGAGSAYMVKTRLGILFGSLAAAALGYAILRAVLPPPRETADDASR